LQFNAKAIKNDVMKECYFQASFKNVIKITF
jgi:hypothetical protein